LKKQLFILFGLIAGIFILTLFYLLHRKDFITDYFDFGLFIFELFIVPLFVLIIPAFIIALLLAIFLEPVSLGKLQFKYILKYSIWTNFVGLVIGFCFILRVLYVSWQFDNYRANIAYNEQFKQRYRGTADSLVNLSIAAIEQKQNNLNDYGLISLEPMKFDTIINHDSVKYFAVSQLYFVGKEPNSTNIYAAKHIILPNQMVDEVYNFNIEDTSLLKDLLGKVVKEQREMIHVVEQFLELNKSD
jgi:hypothetical protein